MKRINPQTRERLNIPVMNVGIFKAGKGLRESVGK
jgi:nucleoid DNA-binding protein